MTTVAYPHLTDRVQRIRDRRERQRVYEQLLRRGFTPLQARGLAESRTTVFLVPLRGRR